MFVEAEFIVVRMDNIISPRTETLETLCERKTLTARERKAIERELVGIEEEFWRWFYWTCNKKFHRMRFSVHEITFRYDGPTPTFRGIFHYDTTESLSSLRAEVQSIFDHWYRAGDFSMRLLRFAPSVAVSSAAQLEYINTAC